MIITISIILTIVAISIVYLRHVDSQISTIPQQARQLVQKDWTRQDISDAYQKAQESPTDVRPFLLPKRQRRYIVVGGSGLVGGWIVHHLLMRGEDPRAIRILDLAPTKRKEAIEAKIDCVLTDVSDAASVTTAFNKDWPDAVRNWPLTVFHTVAYINASERAADFLPKYIAVNINGTRNVLNAARAARASCFISTSSGSVGLTPPSFLVPPFKDMLQLRPNADPPGQLDGPLSSFGSCYAWSKAQAEKVVLDANDPTSGFLVGVIRPGHGIYGNGVENTSSLTWDYLRRGGTPSWIGNVVSHFVCAQNVSIGHLAYEDALLEGNHEGGKGYCVTDPNPPIRYGNLYDVLVQLSATPVNFPVVPYVVMLLFAYMVEMYVLLQQRYLRFLPKASGDLAFLQPAVFNMCTLHLIYTDTAAQEEIGYKAPITTLEGFALAVVDWNENLDASKKSKSKSKMSTIAEPTTGAAVLAT